MVKKTESELGPVDIVVNNAGVFYYTLMKNVHEDEWEQMIDVNCKVGKLLLYFQIFMPSRHGFAQNR